MKEYFSNHPVINYRGLHLRNLMLSAQVIKGILDKISVSYPYTLQDGETPNMVAYDYYGSVDYVWLVFLANNIIDPYTQWHKSQIDFDQYLIKTYGSIEASMAKIHHYEITSDPTYPQVTQTSYNLMQDASIKLQLSPISAYDYENRLNEARRTINLIDATKAPSISLELETLLNA